MSGAASIASMLLWSPSTGYPSSTPTSFHSIAVTKAPELTSKLEQVLSSLATETVTENVLSLSQVYRGAQASLTIISAQQVLATASDSSILAQASKAIFEASDNLHKLADEENLYGQYLNRGGNVFYLALYFIFTLFFTGAAIRSKYHWFNITFICGFILETLGFLGRILSFVDDTNVNYYLMQYVSLTLAAAFFMAGVYFLFAQNVVIHGRQYLVLKPMWYSYFFICADVTSLVVQALGGGVALAETNSHKSGAVGSWIMFGGMIIQVVSMTIFIIFWCDFLTRLYFKESQNVSIDHPLKVKGIKSWLRCFLNTKSAQSYKMLVLDPYYNPKYLQIRQRKLVTYYPLAISVAVLAIYIRCIYRVVELKEGINGYLATHEVYLMVLDALMIAIVGFVFVGFHPMFVFGRNNVLTASNITKKDDESTGTTNSVDEEKYPQVAETRSKHSPERTLM